MDSDWEVVDVDASIPRAPAPSADEWESVDLGQNGNNATAKSPTSDDWEAVDIQPVAASQTPTPPSEVGVVGNKSAPSEPRRGRTQLLEEITVTGTRAPPDTSQPTVLKPGYWQDVHSEKEGYTGRVWVPPETDSESSSAVMAQIPGEIGTQFASRVGGAKEFVGEERVMQAHKRLWQSLVLQGAVRDWSAANLAMDDERERINLTEWPEIVEYARRAGVRPDVFSRDWPEFVNKGPAELREIYLQSVKDLKDARALRARGTGLREEAAQISSAYRPRVDEWSGKGLAFDLATSMPDVLIVAAGSIAGGPEVGLGLMSGAVAPGMYAQGRDMGLNHAQATGYGALMTLAEIAPEMPVLEAISRTPAAKKLMARMLGDMASSRGARIAGTAALEAGSEQITEALQIGIEEGYFDTNISVGDALKRIARAGVIGAGMGGPMGAISAGPGKTRLQPGQTAPETRPQPGADAVPAEEVLGAVEGPAQGPIEDEWEEVDGLSATGGDVRAGGESQPIPGSDGASPGGPGDAGASVVGDAGGDAGSADGSDVGDFEPVDVRTATSAKPRPTAVQPGDAVAPVAKPDADARLTDAGYRDAFEGSRVDVGQVERGGRLLRADGDEGEVTGRTPHVAAPVWNDRPSKGGKISADQAHDALDKVARGETDALNTRQRRYLSYIADEVDARRAEWSEKQQLDAPRHHAEIVEAVPDFDDQDDTTQDITMLAKVAAQYATEEEVESALEAQSDEEAMSRLQTLVDRGWQERQVDPEVRAEERALDIAEEQGIAEHEGANDEIAELEEFVPSTDRATERADEGEAESGAVADRGQGPVPSDEAGLTAGEEQRAASSVPQKSPAPSTDLFGSNVEHVDALNKRNAKVARKLGEGRAAPPADKAPPGDMFRAASDAEKAEAAAAQTDIEGSNVVDLTERIEQREFEQLQKDFADHRVHKHLEEAGRLAAEYEKAKSEVPENERDNSYDEKITGLMDDLRQQASTKTPPMKVEHTAAELVRQLDEGTRSHRFNKDRIALPGYNKNQHGVFDPKATERNAAHRDLARKHGFKVHEEPRTDAIGAAADEAAASPTNDKPEPTLAQKEAGNYAKGHLALHGLDIAIENPKGSHRWNLDVDKVAEFKKAANLIGAGEEVQSALDLLKDNGSIPLAFSKLYALEDKLGRSHPQIGKALSKILDKAWHARLAADYGYIKGYIGKDKDHLDVYLGDRADTPGPVFVMDQHKLDGTGFDEHKVFMGFKSEKALRAAYVESFDDPAFAKRIAGPVREFSSAATFKRWLTTGDLKRPVGEWTDVQRGSKSVERGGPAEAGDRVRQEVLLPEAGRTGASDGRAGAAPGSEERSAGGASVRNGGAAPAREGGDRPGGKEGAGPAAAPEGSVVDERSPDRGEQGILLDHIPAAAVERAATRAADVEKRRADQRRAEHIKVTYGDRDNIARTLPFLFEKQHDDVKKAEDRFAKPDGYGMLFTNGTGTGKTYTGLGIIKRMVRQGKTNGLIVVPSQKIAEDWVRSGKDVLLDINALADTNEVGRGASITTYSNFGMNLHLADREIDWVLIDEAHMLMQNEQAKDTAALDTLRAITLHPDGYYHRTKMLHRIEWRELENLSEQSKLIAEQIQTLVDARQIVPDEIQRQSEMVAENLEKAFKVFQELTRKVDADVSSKKPEQRARTTFLSATPFAYEKNTKWADGYLFEFDKKPAGETVHYNEADGYNKFMVEHFGYRLRTNKLTEPEATVDRGVMQRQFNTWLRNQGVLSARTLEEPFDYDRKFVLVESKVGNKIDEGLDWLSDQKDMKELSEAIRRRFDFLARSRLLEALKARESVSYIRQQLGLGRKVVVFYDFNEGGGFNVFDVSVDMVSDGLEEKVKQMLRQQIISFRNQRKDLVELDTRAESPLKTLLKVFPKARQYNGLYPAKQRTIWVDQFNDDKSDVNLILAQKAANAGWSAHDTTGKFPRVLINLGLPTAPVQAIQIEGRIYRVGQGSDAMFRYFNTGTTWEREAFASTIAQRASTAENLALGEDARGLKDSFIEAFEESDHETPGGAEDGKGGKARDRALAQAISEFDRAKTFYFSNQKKTQRTKAAEGEDYFATPEPLGLKMVEWARPAPDDQLLEPSAGHGAIARFFPDLTKRTVVEPSPVLASKLQLVTDARLVRDTFENLDIVNKYDVIVMNPPFGHGGSTAIEHVDKAFTKHLREGGRIVALIPEGSSATAKFQKWYESAVGAHVVAEYGLPTSTFERAGTKVKARVVIIDKMSPRDVLRKAYNYNDYEVSNATSRREIDGETITDFFDNLEQRESPPRVRNVTEDASRRRELERQLEEKRKEDAKEQKKAAAKSGKEFSAINGTHTKTGSTIFYAIPTRRFSGEEYAARKQTASMLRGHWSSFGTNKGFLFKTENDRDSFIDEYNNQETSLEVLPRGWDVIQNDFKGQGARVLRATFGPKTPVSRAALQAHIDKISKVLPLVDVFVTEGFDGVKPEDQAFVEHAITLKVPAGRFGGAVTKRPDGKRVIYLNSLRMESLSQAEQVLFHEATHRGFRNALGDEAYRNLADYLFVQMGGTSAFPREHHVYFEMPGIKFDVNNPIHRLKVVDEYLANMSQYMGHSDSLIDRAAKLLDAILAWVNRFFRQHGWRRTFSKAEIRDALRSVAQIGLSATTVDTSIPTPARDMAEFAAAAKDAARKRPAVKVTDDVALELKDEDEQLRARQKTFWDHIKQGQFIERAVRLAFLPPGLTINSKGEWTPSPLGRRVARRVRSSTAGMARHAFGFLRPLAERVNRDVVKEYGLDTKAAAAWEAVKAGLVDRYGTPADFVLADATAKNQRTQILDRAKRMVADLEASGMVTTRAEAEALQAVLTGESSNIDAKMAAIAEPIRQVIDQWGAEAVELGLLDRATFERNRATYLHRVYRKHEADYLGASGVVKRLDEAMTKHRRKIIGNQFKRRGISFDVAIDKLRRALPPDWWQRKTDGKKIDVALGESDWVVLSKVRNPREMTPDMLNEPQESKDKVVDRIYWPAEMPIPPKFAGWRNDGTFRAIKVAPGHVTLWRDFTKPERTRMGEILDSRYTFLKTALTAAHDLSTGRLFKQIAMNPEWSRDEPPVLQDGTPIWTEAQPLRRKTYSNFEWVHVPDNNIPGTSTKRYGAMAGKYIRSAIWRDLNEMEIGMAPSTWKWILTQFKKNKTTRNPKTHIFNTMSNVILAYIDDMRAGDWVRGMREWMSEGPVWQEARLHGVFGHDFVDQEIKQELLKPLLEKILKESNLDDAQTKKIKLLTRVFGGIREGVQAVDRAATSAYQWEDEWFRMASYMVHRQQGMSPDEAAIHARRQFIDYDIRAPWINALRYSFIPFISYPYRAIPRVMDAVVKRPWKIATLALLSYAVNELAYALMDDDDEDLQRRLMNENLRGHTWAGTPRLLRLPMNDEYDNPVFLDLRNGLPAANIVDFENSYSAVPTPAWMQIGGPLVMGIDFMQNYNAYREEPIADQEVDTLGQKASKAAGFLWSSYMPSWAPGGYAWDKVSKAAQGRMNQARETSTIGMAVAQSILPIRVESTEKNRRDRVREYQRKLRKLSEDAGDLRRAYQQLSSPDNDDREDLREMLEAIESRRDQVLREMRDTLNGEKED